jgi:seryl-tRNA synthetase
MHDLQAIRKAPESYDFNWARRGLPAQTPAILQLDEQRRVLQTEIQSLQASRNEKSKEIGKIKAQKGDAQSLMDEVSEMKERMVVLEAQEIVVADELHALLSSLPNMIDDGVPDGLSEDDNVEVRRFGEPKDFKGQAKEHFEIGEALGMMEFDIAANMSGSRFVILHSDLARLERALAQFMLNTQTLENGFTEVSPPLMVRDNAVYGVGQLPKFSEDLFRTTTDHWLISTAEVSLTNMVADTILEADVALPIRLTAYTPCFRSEAGSAGRDTRGMLRQHQFYKVEMVCVTTPEQSKEEHERMTACAENILKKLELPFRTMILSAGDMGFGSTRTYDLEVWLPGQDRYREISSCSNCGDFQARRMKARYRKDAKDIQFVHTLNGSGLAVGRTLIAVMENYYDPTDGGVFVPEVLKPYMGGQEKILPRKPFGK